MPNTPSERSTYSRIMQLREQLEQLEVGEIGRIWCNTREEARSIRSGVYKIVKELGWAKDGNARPSPKAAICEESDGWALYVTRFG